MTRYSFIIVIAALFLGCGPDRNDASGEKMTAQKPTDTELAAYAGHATYPNMEATEIKAAAVVSKDGDLIKIYNFTGAPLRSVDVWVNGGFVQHISGIPTQGSVSIKTSELYNGLGKNFSSQKEPVSRVQVKTPEGFYTLMGPATAE